MSREFGSYINGYFHDQIWQGAEDCLKGDDKITRLWGEFLKDFSDIAYAISTSEAADSGEDFPIMKTIEKLPQLQNRLNAIKDHVRVFEKVMEEAVRRKVEEER